MEVAEDRKWAVELTDDDFKIQYSARFPFQDIPGREKYINYIPRKSSSIDMIKAEDMIITKKDQRKQQVKEVKETKMRAEQVFCDYCGKVFTGKGNSKHAHRGTHMKKCPVMLANR